MGTRRRVAAWLILAALLAVLLPADSARNHLFVRRIFATEQVRHQKAEYVVALEQTLRRSSTPSVVSGELPTVEPDRSAQDALWLEARRPDGSVLARRGNVEGRMFTPEEESSHILRHEPLYKIVPSSVGGVVVEVFPLYAGDLFEVRAGDPLVLYSDGLIEATNSSGEEYGVSRLRELLRASASASPHEIRDTIATSVGDFSGAVAPRDDLTLVVARFVPPGRKTAESTHGPRA